MTTKYISKRQKKQWTRYDARGILTRLEKQRLKDGSWRYDRHLRLKVRVKTAKALFADLPLILNKFTPQDFVHEPSQVQFAIPQAREFLKSLLFYFFKLEEKRIMEERVKKKQKLKVAFRETWKSISETIREVKKEIQKARSQKP